MLLYVTILNKSYFVEYIAQTFQEISLTPIDVVTDQFSPEECASNILRCHYAALCQSLHDPVGVGRLLHFEDSKIISEQTLTNLESTGQSESERRIVLLRAVRCAVHTKYNKLEVFAGVLLKFSINVPFANAILKDYSKSLQGSFTIVH